MAGTLEKMRKVLRELVEAKSTQAEVGGWLAIDQSQVSRILNGKAPLEAEKLLIILDGLGVAHEAFFAAALVQGELKPATLLYMCREHAGLPQDPFLEQTGTGCLQLGMHDRPRPAEPSKLRASLLELEDLRFADPESAKKQLEALAASSIANANGTSGPPPGELVGDIAITLAIWASIQRILGRRDDASAALESSDNLADKSEETWVKGLVRQKAAYLLMDRGQARHGIAFLKDAYYLFGLAGTLDWQAKIWVDLGILHNFLGEHTLAISHLETALERLPQSSRRHRFAAHYDLAIALQALGRLKEAAYHLGLANELRPDETLAAAYLKRREGRLHLEAGRLDEAICALRAAFELMERFAPGGTSLLLLTDLAKAAVKNRNLATLDEVARHATGYLSVFRRNKVVCAALQELVLACLRGHATTPLLAKLHEELEAAFPSRSTHLDQV